MAPKVLSPGRLRDLLLPLFQEEGKRQYNIDNSFERIVVGIAGPFLEADTGKKILVAMDYFSKWTYRKHTPYQIKKRLWLATYW